MIARACVLVAFLAVQEEEPPALRFQREIERELGSAKDEEVRQRLGKVRTLMRQRAHESLFGDSEDGDSFQLRIYEIENLTGSIQDYPVDGFWGRPLIPTQEEQTFVLMEPVENALGVEGLVDLIKETVAPGSWEGEQTLEYTPGRQLLVNAPPRVHRQLARFLQVTEQETQRQVHATVWVYAISDGVELAAGPDGAVPEESAERIRKLAADGGAVRRVGRFELTARAEQLVSAFSGREVTFITGYEGKRPLKALVKDGLAVEIRAFPSADAFRVSVRTGFRKVLSSEEIATPAGPLQLPRLAEAECAEDRRAPDGQVVILGKLGPLPAEAKLPPHLVVLGRFSSR